MFAQRDQILRETKSVSLRMTNNFGAQKELESRA